MSSHDPLSESQTTFPSDSENYDANHSNQDSSDEPPSDSSSPMILYSPPTFWSILRGAAINLLLPFVNGLMLGFGELFAHEAAFRLGWSKTKVCLSVGRYHGDRMVHGSVHMERNSADIDCRSFPHTEDTRLVPVSRLETTRLSEGGETARNWICTPRLNERYTH